MDRSPTGGTPTDRSPALPGPDRTADLEGAGTGDPGTDRGGPAPPWSTGGRAGRRPPTVTGTTGAGGRPGGYRTRGDRDLPVLRTRSPDPAGSRPGPGEPGSGRSGPRPAPDRAGRDRPTPAGEELGGRPGESATDRPGEPAPDRPGEAPSRRTGDRSRGAPDPSTPDRAGAAVRPDPPSVDRSPTTTATPAADRVDDGGIRIRTRADVTARGRDATVPVDRSAATGESAGLSSSGTPRRTGEGPSRVEASGPGPSGVAPPYPGSPAGSGPSSADTAGEPGGRSPADAVRARREVSVLGFGPGDRGASGPSARGGRTGLGRGAPTLRMRSADPEARPRPDRGGRPPGPGRADAPAADSDASRSRAGPAGRRPPTGDEPGGRDGPVDAGPPPSTGEGPAIPPATDGPARDAGGPGGRPSRVGRFRDVSVLGIRPDGPGGVGRPSTPETGTPGGGRLPDLRMREPGPAAGDRSTTDRRATDRPGGEGPDRADVDASPTDRPAVDGPDRPGVDGPATDRPGVDAPIPDRPATDPAGQDAADRGPRPSDTGGIRLGHDPPSLARSPADRPAAGPRAGGRTTGATGRSAADRPVAGTGVPGSRAGRDVSVLLSGPSTAPGAPGTAGSANGGPAPSPAGSTRRVFRRPQSPTPPGVDRPRRGDRPDTGDRRGTGDGPARTPDRPGTGDRSGGDRPHRSRAADRASDPGSMGVGSSGGAGGPADADRTGPATTLDRLVARRSYTLASGPGGIQSGDGPGGRSPGVGRPGGDAGGFAGGARRTFATPSLDRVVVDREYDRPPTSVGAAGERVHRRTGDRRPSGIGRPVRVGAGGRRRAGGDTRSPRPARYRAGSRRLRRTPRRTAGSRRPGANDAPAADAGPRGVATLARGRPPAGERYRFERPPVVRGDAPGATAAGERPGAGERWYPGERGREPHGTDGDRGTTRGRRCDPGVRPWIGRRGAIAGFYAPPGPAVPCDAGDPGRRPRGRGRDRDRPARPRRGGRFPVRGGRPRRRRGDHGHRRGGVHLADRDGPRRALGRLREQVGPGGRLAGRGDGADGPRDRCHRTGRCGRRRDRSRHRRRIGGAPTGGKK
ncbi:hypothetical protein BRD00_02780 [Halobacteriales archaeon QS_8_69_26]|nr:MAG: hypothetical protein BRD00_02780 [Halobacteriales archaeon QS_8_69_26]